MACPICGQPSPCAHEQQSIIPSANAKALGGHASALRDYPASSLTISVAGGEMLDQADEKFWRQEVVSRVEQHRARRRRRLDPEATLQLDFQQGMDPSSAVPQDQPVAQVSRKARQASSKIIQFPRSTVPQLRTEGSEELELAEPIVDTPRILDAPEPLPQQMDFLSAFADIQLQAEEPRQKAEFQLPLQPAAMGHRLFAGLVDMVVVLMSGVLFAGGFVMFSGKLPQPRQGLLCSLIVAGCLWLIYQYLFLAYSSGTLGMQLAQLELCTFKGEPASGSLRRSRALASLLSALTLGLGFAWALVDEDTLGWHDRMTQTYLKQKALSTTESDDRA
jgi:uncharacterized RDD family membrane protein YckC